MNITEGFRDVRHERGEYRFPKRGPDVHPAKLSGVRKGDKCYTFGLHYNFAMQRCAESATEKTWRCQDCGAPMEPQDGWCARCGSTLPATWR